MQQRLITAGAIVRIPVVIGRDLPVEVWAVKAVHRDRAQQMQVIVEPWLTVGDRMTVPWTAITEVIAPWVTASGAPASDETLAYCLSHPAARAVDGPAACTAADCAERGAWTVSLPSGNRWLVCTRHCALALATIDRAAGEGR
ncbi:MAG TPA: hypothetical protein VM677_31890 [Actinokineospora sp.]|nr:hypothetical protein [Actinokineospora sp.]